MSGGNGKNLYAPKCKTDRRFRADRVGHHPYQIKNLWENHHEILNLALLGWRPVDIAARLKCSVTLVGDTINSDLGRQKLAIMRAARDADTLDVAKEIQELVPKAFDIYKKILKEETPGGEPLAVPLSLQKATADTIVKDLAGHEAPKKSVVAHLTTDEIDTIKERGRAIKAARESGAIVEAEIAEIE